MSTLDLRSFSKALLLTSLCAALASTVGCGGESGESEAASGGSSGSSNVVIGGNGVGASVGSGGGATVGMSGNMCTIEDDGSGCVGQAYEGESVPLDIYIMFDQSGSMCTCLEPEGGIACDPDPSKNDCEVTRMDAVREATRQFMADPASAGIGIGISYFGKQPFGQASCEAEDHADAAVGIGLLPDHAGNVMESLEAIEPTGETPTAAAIRGACSYAQSWKGDHPGHETVILLLTDGKPEAPVTCGSGGACCPTLEDAVAAATDCREGDPGIKTYVLGVGPLLSNLKDIAEAGGTGDAYLVEGGDVASEVLNALRTIRGEAIPCQMALPSPPDGQELVLNQVNITYASPSCEPTYYSYVETIDLCGEEGGWYYDDPNAPQHIQLCPTSCDQVSVPGGKLVFTVGCATREIPR